MATVIEMSNEILGHVQDIKSAIQDKGGSPTTLSTFATEISNLPSGGGMPDIPSSWVTKTSSFTASSDGFLWYSGSQTRTLYGSLAALSITIGSSTYDVFQQQNDNESSESTYFQGYLPVHSGDSVSWNNFFNKITLTIKFGAV